MEWDVVEVEPKSDLSMRVRFADGTQGSVKFEQSHLFGVFESLKDPAYFCQAYLDSGVSAFQSLAIDRAFTDSNRKPATC